MSTSKKLLAMLLALGFTPAMAATTTANLSVTATVEGTCAVVTTTVAFGLYDPTSGLPDDAEGAVSVTCTNGTTYGITLDAGAHETTPDDVDTRMMLGAVNAGLLPYQLYQDSGHATVWGITTEGMSGLTGSGSAQPYTVYGRIPASQFVQPDTYSDTVLVTVTF